MARLVTLSWPALRWIPGSLVGIGLASILQVWVVRFVTPPWTLTMVQAGIEARTLPRRRVARLEALGEHGPRAFVASEDARFYLHHGFDLEAICGAVRASLSGGRLRGGSSISQQVAKNVFLWQGRSWLRKGLEAWYTVWLEVLLPKDRILELYVNVAQTGPHTFGLEAGSGLHFNKPAASLSPGEAGRLAGILPDPTRSISGGAARRRASWIKANPAPFPGDPGYDLVLDAYRSRRHGLLSCLL
ncbi:MAG TPA: monofunctional biosynthetic peptidoglycan transglycosylase [Deltaproteobacteria bacterium]|nr:monofunctional biosynthetic peptidoglycan transglycosylase [Deltaproteobacteria bacterium]